MTIVHQQPRENSKILNRVPFLMRSKNVCPKFSKLCREIKISGAIQKTPSSIPLFLGGKNENKIKKKEKKKK